MRRKRSRGSSSLEGKWQNGLRRKQTCLLPRDTGLRRQGQDLGRNENDPRRWEKALIESAEAVGETSRSLRHQENGFVEPGEAPMQSPEGLFELADDLLQSAGELGEREERLMLSAEALVRR